MTKSDRKLLLALLLIALFTLLGSKFYDHSSVARSQIVIKVEGEIVKTINLRVDSPRQSLIIDGKRGPAVVEIKGQKVRMLEAPCPDQICVKQGWIEKSSPIIICVPNEIVIYIDTKASVDAITS